MDQNNKSTTTTAIPYYLNETLEQSDPELLEVMKREKTSQTNWLEMIASENYTSVAVLQALSSCLHNRGAKYNPAELGENVDETELLCQRRALEAYNLDPAQWGVNVQPYSGSPANFAVLAALVGPGGRFMGLDMPDGGHFTHGYQTATNKISCTSLFFESMSYKLDRKTGLIDYEQLEKSALLFRPKLIIAGISCYPRHLDYRRFREICDQSGSIMMSDMAHVSGLVAAGLSPSPFELSDVVTTTTYKTLRGPRAGVIYYRKGIRSVNPKTGQQLMYDFGDRINLAVCPGMQACPHENSIAAVATAFKQVMSPQFKQYQQQTLDNARALGEKFTQLGYNVVTGGTDNHMVLVDLGPIGLDGAKGDTILNEISISCNRCSVPSDQSDSCPGGIRLGTPALTTRGMNKDDMVQVAQFIDQGLQLARSINSTSISGQNKTLSQFSDSLRSTECQQKQIEPLRAKVEQFARKFFVPGFENY